MLKIKWCKRIQHSTYHRGKKSQQISYFGLGNVGVDYTISAEFAPTLPYTDDKYCLKT